MKMKSSEIIETSKLRDCGFYLDEYSMDSPFILDSGPDKYDYDNDCWHNHFSLKVWYENGQWICNCVYNHPLYDITKRVTAENIETFGDIQMILDICKTGHKIISDED